MVGMQNKTIRSKLDHKIADWLNSIEDIEVKDAARKDVIVTGGAIASMIMGDKVNDYDIYFKTKDTTVKVAEYYVKKFKQQNPGNPGLEVRLENLDNINGESEERVVIWVESSGAKASDDYTTREDDTEEPEETLEEMDEADDGKEKYRPVFLSENAVTLSNRVQIITRFYGSPDQIHKNYDFVHAKCYYTYDDGKLSTPIEAIRSMQSKVLRYEGSLYPVCSLFRMRKFIKRGWKISAGEILKMAMQISDIDMKNIRVLREQLTGVDALYFHMLIDALKSAPNEAYSENGVLSKSYVIEIIDRIFSHE